MNSFDNLSPEDRKRVSYLKTRDDCAQLAENAGEKFPHLVVAARQRSVEVQVNAMNLDSVLRRDIWSVVYAQEEAIYVRNGRRLRASRTLGCIANRGELGAVAYIVTQSGGESFEYLNSLGLGNYTFEAVVLRHPEHFASDVVEEARRKLDGRRRPDTAEVAKQQDE